MCTFAVGAYLLLAVDAYRAIGLLRANVAPLHDLTACWVGKFACYLYVKFQEPLQGHVRRETLHSLVGDPVLCTTFWALYLQQYRASIINCPHRWNTREEHVLCLFIFLYGASIPLWCLFVVVVPVLCLFIVLVLCLAIVLVLCYPN